MNWKGLFDKKILDRGKEYYESGNVIGLEIAEEEVTAVVEGTEDYDVSILLHDGDVTEMYCDCPYAEDYGNCKHMAAVLFAYEKGAKSRSVSAVKNKKLTPEEIVAKADEATVREFLLKAVKKDKKMLLSLETIINSRSGNIDISLHKRRIDSSIRGYGRFIEYREADGFIDEMLEYLDDIKILADKGNLSEAFELSCYLFEKVSDVDMDDSNGGLGYFGSSIQEFWKEMISESNVDVKKLMFEKLLSMLNGTVIDYMEEYIEDTVFSEFDEKEFVLRKLEFADEKISYLPSDDNWSHQYHLSHWIKIRLGLMEKNGCPEDELLAYCEKYRKLSDVRGFMTDLFIRLGKEDEAIALLEESLKLDSESPGLVLKYHSQLKDLYKKCGQTDKYKDHLRILTIRDYSKETLKEYKSLFSFGEWETERESIISDISSRFLPDLLSDEKMYDRLLDTVKSRGSIFLLKDFEKVLAKEYPDEVLQMYSVYLNNSAKNTANRKIYAEWAALLNRMTKIKGGKNVVKDIVLNWRITYKMRPAMLDELDKVRF